MVVEHVSTAGHVSPSNVRYLRSEVKHTGHTLALPA